jgi:LPXTG-site transpeptidase (sortase) family protein
MKSGIIYDSQKGRQEGQVRLSRPAWIKIVLFFLQGIASGLIAFSVLGVLFLITPWLKQEYKYRFQKKETVKVSSFGILLESIDHQARVQASREAERLGVNETYFTLVIPKINAQSRIMINVDAGNEKEYSEALKKGVAHAKGTAFPGMGQTIYLFAHSTDTAFNTSRYNAVFYLLRELEKGDEIILFFTDKIYRYRVFDNLIVEAGDNSWFKKDQGEVLILQTCWPPGTTWKRLLILARPI